MTPSQPEKLGPKEFRVWVVLKLEKILEEVQAINRTCAGQNARLMEVEKFCARHMATRPFVIGVFTMVGAIIGAAAMAIVKIFIGGSL
ncbi:MAG: hypothetical protein E3J72_08090 [Planctomycetota bacterium]|nr:MAG: hypothetical protein E3J72_08090 [Planctomycetota bacterium]